MKTMFEVTFLVDVKRFGEVLASLDGKAYNLKHRLIRSSLSVDDQDQLSLPAPEQFVSKYDQARALLEKLKSDNVYVIKTSQLAHLIQTEGNYASTLMSRLNKEKHVKRVRLGVFEIRKSS
jgi:hypothetical protein